MYGYSPFNSEPRKVVDVDWIKIKIDQWAVRRVLATAHGFDRLPYDCVRFGIDIVLQDSSGFKKKKKKLESRAKRIRKKRVKNSTKWTEKLLINH